MVSSCGQWRLLSDLADALADLSLCWVHTAQVNLLGLSCCGSFLYLQTVDIQSCWNRQTNKYSQKYSLHHVKYKCIHQNLHPTYITRRHIHTQCIYMSCLRTKPTKRHVRPWRKLGSLATHWAHSKDSDQTGRTPRQIWVFAGWTVILLVLSWGILCARSLVELKPVLSFDHVQLKY